MALLVGVVHVFIEPPGRIGSVRIGYGGAFVGRDARGVAASLVRIACVSAVIESQTGGGLNNPSTNAELDETTEC